MHVQESLGSATDAAASKVMWTGSATATAIGGLTDSAFGMWSGIIIGLAGFVVNWYFKWKASRRNEKALEAYIERLKRSGHVPFDAEEPQ